MDISKSDLKGKDVYVDYNFENVLFRFEHKTRTFFRKFYGEDYEVEVKYNNRLLNDAIRFGDESDEHTYKTGKPGDDFQRSIIG
jgi:hypothetical protein